MHGVWVRSHADGDIEVAALAAGLRLFGGPHALARMVAHQAPASPVGRGDRIVTRAPDPHVLATVVAAAFEERGISAAVASALIDNPRLLMAEGALAFLVVVDGHAVASTIAFLESPYEVLSYIGTVPAARRRGAATEVAVAAMCAAIESGARHLGLQATQEAKALYRHLGFAEVTTYSCYLVRRR